MQRLLYFRVAAIFRLLILEASVTWAGRLTGCVELWEHCIVTIHCNDCLRRIDKFKYILSYFNCQARQAIVGTRVLERNYDAAIGILKERFGRNDLLADKHLDELLSLSPFVRSKNVHALRFRSRYVPNQLFGVPGVPHAQYCSSIGCYCVACLRPHTTVSSKEERVCEFS